MSKNINDLRDSMFETLEKLKNKEITVEEARAVSELGQTIINSAKAEIDFIKATDSKGSGFIPEAPALPNNTTPALPNGVLGITRHRIAG